MVEVPTIDIAGLFDRRGEQSPPVDSIAAAAEEFGFFQIVGHGVSDELVAEVWAATKSFFAMDRAEKLALLRTRDNSRGYYDRELTKNARDRKEVFDFAHVPHPELPDDDPANYATVDGFNQWPTRLDGFRPTMKAYIDECERVARVLLDAFATSLGLAPEELSRWFGRDHTSFVRLNHYPVDDPLDETESSAATPLGDMSLHHHSDSGALTVLLQDEVGGLQVLHEGSWIDVEPRPGAFVVNTGDMMQVWSNDRYAAAVHRVAPRNIEERYSIPYFFNPSYSTDYAPLTATDENPARYRTMNWGAFRQARADGDFADYGEEVQIAQYRVVG